eukprot:8532549-Pyramimonas_sp.AAC.1
MASSRRIGLLLPGIGAFHRAPDTAQAGPRWPHEAACFLKFSPQMPKVASESVQTAHGGHHDVPRWP